MKKLTFLFIFSLLINLAQAQQNTNLPIFNLRNGFGVTAPDSSFGLNMRMRIQNKVAFNTASATDFSVNDIEARIRRCRLKFDGFAYNENLQYGLELGFTRGDLDWNGNDVSKINTNTNIILDAKVSYRFTKHFTVIFGQTKLPGNRQRVVSSGDMQFVDRSILNSLLNIDRDFGFQGVYNNKIGKVGYVLKGAVTGGEGRNTVSTDNGLAYTGRAEILPFGSFTDKGDYFEGDLAREKKPKLSVAGFYHFNDNAKRTGSQLGKDLYAARDIETMGADAVFKYRGFALSGEYIMRNTSNPFTVNSTGATRHIYTGSGENIQASYLFKNNIEIAGRYTAMHPSQQVKTVENPLAHYALGCSQYLNGHKVKIQEGIRYEDVIGGKKSWAFEFQVELGI
jgi:phosphate-selective porin OprO and OprP